MITLVIVCFSTMPLVLFLVVWLPLELLELFMELMLLEVVW